MEFDRFMFHALISFILGVCIGGARLKVIPGFVLMLFISFFKEFFDYWYLSKSGFVTPSVDDHLLDVFTNMICSLIGFLIINNLTPKKSEPEKKVPDALIKHYEKKRRIARLNRMRRGMKNEY